MTIPRDEEITIGHSSGAQPLPPTSLFRQTLRSNCLPPKDPRNEMGHDARQLPPSTGYTFVPCALEFAPLACTAWTGSALLCRYLTKRLVQIPSHIAHPRYPLRCSRIAGPAFTLEMPCLHDSGRYSVSRPNPLAAQSMDCAAACSMTCDMLL